MHDSDFIWLIDWCKDQCNGDWEHGGGITVSTLDNPGWSFTVDLEGTLLEDKEFIKIKSEQSDDNWFICFVDNNKFEGRCGIKNLIEVIRIFRKWVTSSSS